MKKVSSETMARTLPNTRVAGFTLIELMVVVGIIAILAALAVPRFQKFTAKARQAEATTNLSHIYTLQATYQLDNDTFSVTAALTTNMVNTVAACLLANDIGFTPTDCVKIRYLYTNAGAAAMFTSTAAEIGRRVVTNCMANLTDTWTVNEERTITATTNAVNECLN